MAQLQQASAWRLNGRAAAAVGTQGWQASLDWRQDGLLPKCTLRVLLGWVRW